MNRRTAGNFLFAVLIAAPTYAHHNMSAIFDFNQRFTETGSLADMDWRNPHIYLFVEVESDNGEIEKWSFEGPPPVFFRNRDFARSDIEASLGMTVTVEASRARDGSLSGLIRELTLADGRVISACPQNC
jgi:Family of unknown function (DUF6152)